MKHNFKILFFILFTGSLLHSCKKADFSEMDPNFVGKWNSAYSGIGSGISFTFSENDRLTYTNLGDNSSHEDDEGAGGTARVNGNVIKLKKYKFKIEEYPIRFDTIISRGGYFVPTTWRIKLKIGYRFYTANSWKEEATQSFFKE